MSIEEHDVAVELRVEELEELLGLERREDVCREVVRESQRRPFLLFFCSRRDKEKGTHACRLGQAS